MLWRVTMAACLAAASQAQTLATFTLEERFGVSHPDQFVEFAYGLSTLSTSSTKMLGPSGQEVFYQKLSTGNILVRTSLPASRISTAFRITQIDPKTGAIGINLNQLSGAYPVSGDVIRCEGATLPVGLVDGRNYFLKQVSASTYRLSSRKDLSDTIEIASASSFVARKQGWIVDPGDPAYTLYAKAHNYRTGEPVWLNSSGTLPDPLLANRAYYVIRVSSDTFRVAASFQDAVAGIAIKLNTLGTGIFQTSVRWSWMLVAGRPAVASNAASVQLADFGKAYQITNGLTGVRVAKPEGNPSPYNQAPIQGIRLADNSWTATGPNYLYQPSSQQLIGFAASYSVSVVESGPLLVRLRANYVLNRPQYTYGSGLGNYIVAAGSRANTITLAGNQYYWNGSTSVQFHANGGTLPCGLAENKLYWPFSRNYNQSSSQTTFQLAASPGGPPVTISCSPSGQPYAQETMNLGGAGYFTETISLYAGHKSIVIEDDTDSQLQYFLNFYSGSFAPNQARYRGHSGSSVDCGYSLRGSTKEAYTGYTDALYDLSFAKQRNSSYNCDANNIKSAPVWYLPNSGYNTGWYWEFYDSAGSASSPLIGYYIGRMSRYITPIFSGPGVYTSPTHFAANKGPAEGITMHVELRGADGRSTQRTRREWAIYVSTNADLQDTRREQPIGIERNVLAGINLTRLATYVFKYPDPPGGWPPPYRDRATYSRFVRRIQTDPSFVDYANNASPELRDLIAMWQGNTTEDIEMVVSHLEQFAMHWQNILVNQNGDFDTWWHYYQPGLIWEPLLTRSLAVLSSSLATPAQRDRTKAVAAFAASVFWDNDYVPWDVNSGEGSVFLISRPKCLAAFHAAPDGAKTGPGPPICRVYLFQLPQSKIRRAQGIYSLSWRRHGSGAG